MVSPIQTNFTAGEISPRLAGRIDLAKYFNSAKTILNATVFQQGGVSRRGGTRFVAEAKFSDKKARLVDFEFSTSQAYVLEFGDFYMRVFTGGGQILDGGLPYEIATPYGENDLADLQWVQSADVLYLVHPNYAPRKLQRFADTNWVLDEIVFEGGPFLPENLSTTTITPSGVSGSVSLSASAPVWQASHVGSIWKIRPPTGTINLSEWEAGTTYPAGSQVQYDGSVYSTTLGGVSGDIPPTHRQGAASDGGVTWDYLHDGFGWVKITSFTDPQTVSGTVIRHLPTSDATTYWAEGAFSDAQGYPRAIALHEERLVLAATSLQPQTMFFSVTQSFEDFTSGDEDDAAMTYTLAADQINEIRWLAPLRVLLAGTSGGTFRISGRSTDEPITPATISVQRQTAQGSAALPAVIADSAVLYVQRAGRKLMETGYNFEADSYLAADLTLLADHISQSGFAEMIYAAEPHGIIWGVRVDGSMIGLTYLRRQDIVAWHHHTTDGDFESLAAIADVAGEQDQIWTVVRRDVNGQSKRYIEVFEPPLKDDQAQEDGFYVDSGLSYDGPETDNISGLGHLEGKQVSILADGAVLPPQIVSGGTIELSVPASKVHVGLAYSSIIETQNIEMGTTQNTAQAKIHRIHEVFVRLYRSLGLKIGPSVNAVDLITFRGAQNPMDQPPELFTGDVRIDFDAGYRRSGGIVLVQDQPLPMSVLAIMPRLRVENA